MEETAPANDAEDASEAPVEEKEPPVVLLGDDDDDDEDDDEQVRRLAAALAPQVQELDALLASPPPLESRSSVGSLTSSIRDDEDDGMGSEEKRLEASQQLLRQELEFAQDWSALMASPLRQDFIARELAHTYGVEVEEEEKEPQKHSYTITNHAETLGMEVDGGWYLLQTKLSNDVLEYVVPLPSDQLKRLYIGLAGDQPEADVAEQPSAVAEEGKDTLTPAAANTGTPSHTARTTVANRTEPLPVRTVVVWIRPDVLCGAVMDAMYHALDDLGHVTKRQGGHLTGVVGACVGNSQGQAIMHPSYLVDAQLCTYKGTAKGKQGQRTLVLRVYHHDVNADDDEDENQQTTVLSSESMDESSNALLKEAAALVQKMEAGSTEIKKRSTFASLFSPSKVYTSAEAVQEVISRQLLRGYRPCPSVQEGRLTLPALSEQDAPVINASWRWIDACWNELETRDLCYSTLSTCRFGAFPALPTLDVQYCSQLRRLSREGMIVSLLKSASELEEYAREAEYACANLIQMLRPTFDAYYIEPPALPQPLPLTAYPLDFTPPQSSCPPWGMRVMEALNRIAAITDEANAKEQVSKTAFEMSDDAVQMVLTAFQQQDDEEQGARLGRKNVQVMDRLAKMQAHKRASIAAIRDSYGRNDAVVQAADEFHCKAQQACSADGLSPDDQVPLFKCSVLVRSSTGTCYITSSQILFVTQFIPIVGGQICTLFDLAGLQFVLLEGSSSLLNPLPTSVTIKRDGQEVFSFRPSHGAARLVAFIQVIQTMASTEADEELTFSDRGGLLYMYGDSPVNR